MMKFKELLVPLALALVCVLFINFWFKKPEAPKQQSTAGQMLEVQHDLAAVAPLTWGITFTQEPKKDAPVSVIDTSYAQMTFSSAGAAIEKLQFKHQRELITSIQAHTCQTKAFIIAFDDKTPCDFALVNRQETDKDVTLTYQASLENNGVLTKTFVIDKKLPKIALTINIAAPQPLTYIKKLRVFYPAPIISGAKAADVHAFVNDRVNEETLNIYRSIPEITNKTWLNPTVSGITDRFFVHAMIGDPQKFTYRCAFSEPEEGKELIAQIESKPLTTNNTQWTLNFYFGPKEMSLIKDVDSRLEHLYEYGFWAPFSKGILIVLNFIESFTGNFGLAILLLALLIKILLLPLTVRGDRAMAQNAKKQADLTRKLQHLQVKYHDDPERLRQEKEALMREHGVGGLLSGCLPILLQIPIFFALQKLLSTAIELYHAPFLWIGDLSSPDRFYILSILLGASVAITSLQASNKPIKQQFTTLAFALMFSVFTIGLPAGVTLYLVSSTFLGVIQSRIFKSVINK